MGLSLCDGIITNCIIWGNTSTEIYNSASPTYSCVQGGSGGTGNIANDPRFVDPFEYDLHLMSQAGRWNPISQSWQSDVLTSPCVDTANPASSWSQELWPHGQRANMGAYGGTSQASFSTSNAGNLADLNHSGTVDLEDFCIMVNGWILSRPLLAQDVNRDGSVNTIDFAILCDNWSWQQP